MGHATWLAGRFAQPRRPVNKRGSPSGMPAPRLTDWAESFAHGKVGPSRAPTTPRFFSQAVGIIDVACDDFVPPG